MSCWLGYKGSSWNGQGWRMLSIECWSGYVGASGESGMMMRVFTLSRQHLYTQQPPLDCSIAVLLRSDPEAPFALSPMLGTSGSLFASSITPHREHRS